MIKFTVLFVDDEPYVLLSLERIFRRLRHEYDFHFVESGQSALKFMAEHKVDVIVSDMRMPSMDGATLLAIVQDISPHTIRIMLTGQADQKSVLQTLGTVHQFIAKPTDSEKLQKVIEGFRELHGVLHNEELRTHV